MQLVEQKTAHDCAICSIAMALGLPYDQVLATGIETNAFDPESGCRNEQTLLKALGLSNRYSNGEPVGDFSGLHRGFYISPEYFRAQAWGRRALITVPSLNKEGGWHMVYWDGGQLWDPSTRKRYERFAELKPEEIVLFRECGRAAPDEPASPEVRQAAA